MRRVAVTAVVVGALLAPATASAHRSPGDCLANGLDLTLAETSTLVRQGDTLTFIVGIQNVNALIGKPCDVTNGGVAIRLPSPDGRYNPAVPATPVVSGRFFQSGFTFQEVG